VPKEVSDLGLAHAVTTGGARMTLRSDRGAVNASSSPLRLQLGADAVDGIRQKLANVAADLNATEVAARATAFARDA
jgi:hypothetical protein